MIVRSLNIILSFSLLLLVLSIHAPSHFSDNYENYITATTYELAAEGNEPEDKGTNRLLYSPSFFHQKILSDLVIARSDTFQKCWQKKQATYINQNGDYL
ncbi:hypothetical protein [Evansella cellulosilytica]|uniref:Uncharacterized protein n=1 Tax=Evansella cellulosilytica (strain ATCC 21833 / DSM 2522 / FERM P-1141 / JCM 9156 / N-4) TaxID=649639 RepID=E6TQS6_EVAC2|nr:hypothetical protein [Evansella cellulosilytica]ADU31701.1 hypothetical protein Bcell_3459 [Evansella cellulosilytica DSM 2522]